MTRNQRIKHALKASGISQDKLAESLGITQAGVGKQLNKEDDIDSIAFIKEVSTLTGFSFEWIITGSTDDLYMLQGKIEKGEPAASEEVIKYLAGKSIRPVTVTVEKTGRELITLVNVKARAGYARGFGDAGYIEKLPAFSLPMLKDGSYRMFEVDGDSMQQIGGGGLRNGDIVIAQYVEDIFSIKDNRVYVVVSIHGVVVKRCLNNLKLKESPTLICKSDNKDGNHENIVYRPHEIREVWELKAFISRQLGFATDIWDVLKEMETKMSLMDEKIKRISDEKRLAP